MGKNKEKFLGVIRVLYCQNNAILFFEKQKWPFSICTIWYFYTSNLVECVIFDVKSLSSNNCPAYPQYPFLTCFVHKMKKK